MGIKTEDMYKNLPPKVITEGVDWLGILDAFDRRNWRTGSSTNAPGGIPMIPVISRIRLCRWKSG